MSRKRGKKTQREMILEHLKSGQPLDRMQALNLYGCIESPAVISGLRKEGYQIKTGKKEVQTRFAGMIPVAVWTMERDPARAGCTASEYASVRG